MPVNDVHTPPPHPLKNRQIGFSAKKMRHVMRPIKKTIFRFRIFLEVVDVVLKIFSEFGLEIFANLIQKH